MEDILCLALSFLGLMSTLKGQYSDTMVSQDGPSYDRPSYEISGYQDDEQIRQSRRRERAKDRRAEESRRNRCAGHILLSSTISSP
jgi:hypothetical protein